MAANRPFANLDRLSKLATPSVLAPSPSVQQGTAKVNPRFANQISLSDRLRQTNLGTTKHLAQYFVTDQFTNVIAIKKPIEIPKQSLVEIIRPSEGRAQGGELPRFITYSPIQGGQDPRAVRLGLDEKQGIIKVPDAWDVSNITIVPPTNTTNKGVEQGTYYLNGKYFSVAETQQVKELVNQGTIEIQKNITIREQGGEEFSKPIGVATIERAQGVITIDNKSRSVTSVVLPIPEVMQGEGYSPILTAEPDAYISDQRADIKTLRYAGTGLSLRFFPEVFQGSVNVFPSVSPENHQTTQHTEGGTNPVNQSNRPEVGFVIRDTRRAMVSAILNPPQGAPELTEYDVLVTTEQFGSADPRLGSNLDQYGKVGQSKEGDYTAYETELYNSKARQQRVTFLMNPQANLSGDAMAALIKTVLDDSQKASVAVKGEQVVENPIKDYETFFKGANQSKNNTVQQVDGQTNPNVAITNVLGDTGDASSKIVGLLNKIDWKEHRGNFSISSFIYDDISNYNQMIAAANKFKRSNGIRPTSAISIAPVEGGDVVVFDAFLTSFSDSVSATYADYKHIGQMDTFKVYSGTTRQLSVGWKAVAMPGSIEFTNSDVDARSLLRDKINKLMNICAVGTAQGQYIKAPIIRIQVAGMVTGLICACGSVKVDVPIGDTTWDVDSQLPHQYDVSLDLAVLAMEGDELLKKYGFFYQVQ